MSEAPPTNETAPPQDLLLSTDPPPYSEHDAPETQPLPLGGATNKHQGVSIQPQAAPPVLFMDRSMIVVETLSNSRIPTPAYCPHCSTNIITQIHKELKSEGWMWCVIFFIIGVVFFWTPFCMDELKEFHHYCPECEKLIAVCKDR